MEEQLGEFTKKGNEIYAEARTTLTSVIELNQRAIAGKLCVDVIRPDLHHERSGQNFA